MAHKSSKNNPIQDVRKLIQTRSKHIASVIRSYNNKKNPDFDRLACIYEKAYQDPIKHTVEIIKLRPFETFIITGGWKCYGPPCPDGIMANTMWIRDACGQLHVYLNIFQDEKYSYPKQQLESLKKIIIGLIRKSVICLQGNFYAHAFGKNSNPTANAYEPDTHCYLIKLAYDFWKTSGSKVQFDSPFEKLMATIVDKFKKHQYHDRVQLELDFTGMTWSETRASDDDCWRPFHIPNNIFISIILDYVHQIALECYKNENLAEQANDLRKKIIKGIEDYGVVSHHKYGRIYSYETDGTGTLKNNTFYGDGEKTDFHLNFTPFSKVIKSELGIPDPSGTQFKNPANSIEVILSEWGKEKILIPGKDYHIEAQMLYLSSPPPQAAAIKIRGNFILMDDASIPSLLSIPYLYANTPPDKRRFLDETYDNTRRFILSNNNPYYFKSKSKDKLIYSGTGSSHIWYYAEVDNYIWPMAQIMQGFSAEKNKEKIDILNMLIKSAQEGSGFTKFCNNDIQRQKYPARDYIHESYNADNPSEFTRGWFSWVNALFAEWLDDMVTNDNFPHK